MANSKKSALFDTAEYLFVTQHLQLTEIASQVRVSERTLVSWKSEGKWEKKRKDYLAEATAFHTRLMRFATNIMDKIEKDWDDDNTVVPARLYALKGIIDKIPKIKSHEDALQKENQEEQSLSIPKEALADPKIREALRVISERMNEYQ